MDDGRDGEGRVLEYQTPAAPVAFSDQRLLRELESSHYLEAARRLTALLRSGSGPRGARAPTVVRAVWEERIRRGRGGGQSDGAGA